MPYRFKVFYTPGHVSLEKNIYKNDIHCTDEEYQMKDEKKKQKEKNIFQYPQSLINVLLCSSVLALRLLKSYTVLYVYRAVTAWPTYKRVFL